MTMCTMALDNNYIRLAQFYAANASRKQMLEEILKYGDINYQIPANPTLKLIKLDHLEGCTALHIALKCNDYPSFEKLVHSNADYTIKNSNGDTVVHAALNMPSKNAKTPLELKSTLRNFFIDCVLSIKRVKSINPRNKHGLSHLHAACIIDNAEAVEDFLIDKAPINEAINLDSPYLPGFTPLHCAARYHSIKAAKILVEFGATGCFKDAKGLTPFHLIIERNMEIMDWINMGKRDYCDSLKKELHENNEFIGMMLEKNGVINRNLMDKTGLSYLHIVCTLEDTLYAGDAIKTNIDLEQSVSEDSPLWPGYTALHFATHFNINTFKLLLNKGANLFAQDAKGIMPFNLYIERYEAKEMEFLINSQTDWKYTRFSNDIFLTVLLQAMGDKNILITFLEDIMKDINVSLSMDSILNPGYTPLHFAVDFKSRSKELKFMEQDKQIPIFTREKKIFNCCRDEEELYLKRIMIMLKAGADVTAQDYYGSTPIHLAFQSQRDSVVNLLLKHHKLKDVNPINNVNLSHLHIACAAGNHDLVEKLLDECIDVNHATMYNYRYKKSLNTESYDLLFTAGSTALHIAVIAREAEIVQLLLSYGADVYARDAKGMTPIHRLLTHDIHYRVVEIGQILFSNHDFRDCVTSFGLSHLHIASHVNHVEAINGLLNNGADIKAEVKYEKLTVNDDQPIDYSDEALSFLSEYYEYRPRDFAVRDNCIEAFDILIKRDWPVSVNPLDSIRANNLDTFLENLFNRTEMKEALEKTFGSRTLHMGCFIDDVDAVKQSLDNGVDVNSQLPETSKIWPGFTPLHLLLRKRSNGYSDAHVIISIVELLIKFGVDITLKNSNGVTPLIAIFDQLNCNFFEKALADVLLYTHKDFRINPTNITGFSHFHIACICDNVYAVKKFLKKGVDVNQTIEFFSNVFGGYTPLHFAVNFFNNKTIKLLLKYFADVDARNRQGNSPIHFAVPWNDNEKMHVTTIKRLVSAGGKLHVKNAAGETPFKRIIKMSRQQKKLKFPYNEADKVIKILPKYQCFVNIFSNGNKGYIAKAIKDLNAIEDIMENPIFASVMKAPDKNRVDEINRTPIHNIVAIEEVEASVEVYIQAIQEFIKLGSDIDFQDERGSTALHYAVRFHNSTAVAALLSLGADINLPNDSGNSPLVDYLTEDDEIIDEFDDDESDELSDLGALVEYFYKLQLLNLTVNQRNKWLYDVKNYQERYITITMAERCEVELKKLESRKIGSTDILLFSFLSDTKVITSYPQIRPLDRPVIDDFFQKDVSKLRQEFPEFSGILQMQYRKALKRADLLENARYSFDVLTEFSLPYLCSTNMFKFLTNDELKNLIASEEAIVMPPQKRKRSCT